MLGTPQIAVPPTMNSGGARYLDSIVRTNTSDNQHRYCAPVISIPYIELSATSQNTETVRFKGKYLLV